MSPLSAEQRESWRARNLRRAIRLSDSSSIALQLLLRARRQLETVRQSHPRAGGLVIARDIDHATAIGRLLEEEGDRVDLVHSQDPEAARRLSQFQDGPADWLVSIDMCAEGFDAPRLRVVAYLTTVVTRSRFVQGITRACAWEVTAAVEAIPETTTSLLADHLMGYARSWSFSGHTASAADKRWLRVRTLAQAAGAVELAPGSGERWCWRNDPLAHTRITPIFAAIATSACVDKCELCRKSG